MEFVLIGFDGLTIEEVTEKLELTMYIEITIINVDSSLDFGC